MGELYFDVQLAFYSMELYAFEFDKMILTLTKSSVPLLSAIPVCQCIMSGEYF